MSISPAIDLPLRPEGPALPRNALIVRPHCQAENREVPSPLPGCRMLVETSLLSIGAGRETMPPYSYPGRLDLCRRGPSPSMAVNAQIRRARCSVALARFHAERTSRRHMLCALSK